MKYLSQFYKILFLSANDVQSCTISLKHFSVPIVEIDLKAFMQD